MKRIGAFFLQIWIIGLMLSIPYYNWQYAKEHGFLSWLFFGEVVATAKGFVWPYYWAPAMLNLLPQPDLGEARRPTNDSAEPSRQYSADVVAAAAFVREVLLLNQEYSELGLRLGGSTGQERTDMIAEAGVRHRAMVMYAAVIDRDSVNRIYPELGSRLADQLLASHVLAEELLANKNPDRMPEVYSLTKEFTDWFNPRMPEIIAELNEIPQTTSRPGGRAP